MNAIALRSKTPVAWADRVLAPENLPAFLADHAVCELQASVYALSLVGSYPGVPGLADALSALAAEELTHFRKASREAKHHGAPLHTKRRNWYVAGLRAACRSGAEPARGLDLLLVAALIEARSHERFERLLERVTDPRLAKFYGELAEAEARHGPVYLDLAAAHAGDAATEKRLDEMLDVEAAALAAVPRREIAVHGAA
ncbi:MAG: tRNA-(ms[2]io[6]A)-hydroxylase [Acidobacteria bacterium]|nr:tRNA-(ms[2]io[6]A)-hydroxylase [Acidobacteriota bacterium]